MRSISRRRRSASSRSAKTSPGEVSAQRSTGSWVITAGREGMNSRRSLGRRIQNGAHLGHDRFAGSALSLGPLTGGLNQGSIRSLTIKQLLSGLRDLGSGPIKAFFLDRSAHDVLSHGQSDGRNRISATCAPRAPPTKLIGLGVFVELSLKSLRGFTVLKTLLDLRGPDVAEVLVESLIEGHGLAVVKLVAGLVAHGNPEWGLLDRNLFVVGHRMLLRR